MNVLLKTIVFCALLHSCTKVTPDKGAGNPGPSQNVDGQTTVPPPPILPPPPAFPSNDETNSGANTAQLGDPSTEPNAWDHFIRDHGGVIPGDFASLMAMARADASSQLVTQIIPYSRSPQGSFTDAHTPRVMAAFIPRVYGSLPPSFVAHPLENRLFFAYAAGADEIEIFAWNDHRGAFDFLTIDYRPQVTPVATRVIKEACTDCHQNGGPIFSRKGSSRQYERATTHAWMDANSFAPIQSELAKHHSTESYLGVPVFSTFYNSSRFDRATDLANGLTKLQKIWQESCGPSLSCRRAILAAGFDASWDHTPYADVVLGFGPNESVINLMNEWTAHWPSTGIDLALADISNFNPLDHRRATTLPPEHDPTTSRPLIHLAKSSILSTMSQYQGLFYGGFPPHDHPMEEERPQSPWETLRWFQVLFTYEDIELIKSWAGHDRSLLMRQIQAGILDEAASSPVLNRTQVIQALRDGLAR